MADCVGVGWLQNFCFRNFAKLLMSRNTNLKISQKFCKITKTKILQTPYVGVE